MHLTVIQLFYVLFSFYHGIDATHFRGGTISWKPTGNGTEVINHNFNDSITKQHREPESNDFFFKMISVG